MYRDYWVYQERDVKEPWAAHVHAFAPEKNRPGYIDVAFYAEYAPSKSKRYIGVILSYNHLLGAFEEFSKECGVEFTLDEVKQVNRLWLSIAHDLKLEV